MTGLSILSILILAVLLALVIINKKSPQPLLTGIIYTLLVLCFVVQTTVFMRGCKSGKTDFIPSFHQAAGKKLGEFIAKAHPEGGMVVVVLGGAQNPQAPQALNDTEKAQVAGLRDAFADSELSLVELVIEPPENIMVMAAAGTPISSDEFYNMLTQEDGTVAAIACIGLPPLTTRVRTGIPPLYLLEMVHESEGRRFLSGGLIQGGVFTKSGADWTKKPRMGMSEKEAFEIRYILLTGDDA